LKGITFNEREVWEFLSRADLTTRFDAVKALRYFIIHLFFFLGLSPVGILLGFLFEGWRNMKNMGFFSLNGVCFSQWMNSTLVSASFYYLVIDIIDPPEGGKSVAVTNFIHFILNMVIRSMIIAVKYGYYSPEHTWINQTCVLTDFLN